jgi:hypothetical protein
MTGGDSSRDGWQAGAVRIRAVNRSVRKRPIVMAVAVGGAAGASSTSRTIGSYRGPVTKRALLDLEKCRMPQRAPTVTGAHG